MTVRLPSRMKEGNKRCRGMYVERLVARQGSLSALPARPARLLRCRPLSLASQASQTDRGILPPATQPSPAHYLGTLECSQQAELSCLGLVSRPVRVSGPIFLLPDPTRLGGGGPGRLLLPPTPLGIPPVASLHSLILHPVFCPARPRPHKGKGFNLYYVDSCASRPPYHNIIRLHAPKVALAVSWDFPSSTATSPQPLVFLYSLCSRTKFRLVNISSPPAAIHIHPAPLPFL